METKKLISDLLEIQENYSFVKRNLVTADRYEQIAMSGLVAESDLTNEVLREPLLEHVGHLPILASYFHPHIEHSNQIDLGRSLIMLSIHDIGETLTGDIFTYDKTIADDKEEYVAALQLLTDDQKAIYKEYEARETLEARYAKAIDAYAPIVHSMYRPQIKIDHFKMKGATIQDIINKKTKYFEWDSVLKKVFELSIEHYLKIEAGEEGIFLVK